MEILTEEVNSFEGAFPTQKIREKIIEIAEDQLEKNLIDCFKSLSKVLNKLPNTCGEYEIQELNVTLQITSSGGIQLVGKSMVGASGGLNFKLVKAQK